MSNRDVVGAFAFGRPSTIRPNRRLAGIARDVAEDNHGVIYTQRDIDIADTGVSVERVEEPEGTEPPPTLRIARGLAEFVKSQPGVKYVWVVAAMPHLPRAYRDVRKAFSEAGITNVSIMRPIGRLNMYERTQWYSNESTQVRTTSPFRWWSRELILRIMPFWFYKRVRGVA